MAGIAYEMDEMGTGQGFWGMSPRRSRSEAPKSHYSWHELNEGHGMGVANRIAIKKEKRRNRRERKLAYKL